MRSFPVDPASLYPTNPLFVDFLANRAELLDLFERRPSEYRAAADRRTRQPRPRTEIADALAEYNRSIGAPAEVLHAVDALRAPDTSCVITGQQAGLLGGPIYTAYKILTTIRLARRLSERLAGPVVPVFWLASEDHDLTEIHRVRWVSPDGALHAIGFDLPDVSCAAECLPLSDEIRHTKDDLVKALDLDPELQNLVRPENGDDYARWHARIWSRLFGADGLVLIEPRVLRPSSGAFFERALERKDLIRSGLHAAARRLSALGYHPSLDAEVAGSPFRIADDGRRTRVPEDAYDPSVTYSADAALRPVLADALLPTVASVLGPGELAYHAQLRPVYEALDVAQPVFVSRRGYTLVSTADAALLETAGISVAAALDPTFDPQPQIAAQVPTELRAAFDRSRDAVRTALAPLGPIAHDADPGLEARWRQVADRADRDISQLEERVARAELARNGLSIRRLRAVLESLRPAGEPQERVLSLIHPLARFGVEWLHRLPGAEHPDRAGHDVVILDEQT